MYKSSPSHAKMHKKMSNKFKMYADSHQFVRDMLANPGIDEGEGGYSTYIYLGGLGACCRKIFEIFVP